MVQGKKIFTGLKRKIEFKHMNFSYTKDVQILKDLSFSIEKDKTIAIVGSTGSGKTTILNLLMRFYDIPPNTIFIDGTDIKDFSVLSLHNYIAIASQDALLFNDTIRNNLTYGLTRKISDKELYDALRKARLFRYVMALPNKVDAYIGERGVRLSGGEKQRLVVARMLIKSSEIFMLDEATSSLDSKTEQLVQEAINEVVKNRTSIIIAHRLSTIKHADKVLVIEDGKLVEAGSLDELIDKKGKFFEYWKSQKFY